MRAARGSARLAGATGLIGGALLFGLLLFGIGCSSPVAGGVDETQADAILVALGRAGVDATKENDSQNTGKFVISVSHDEAPHALAILAAEELPRPSPVGILDTVGKGDLVPSIDSERAAYAAGLSGELAQTLESVDGVLRARVHLNLPDADPLRNAPPPKATASVLLTIREGVTPIAVDEVQKIVAAGAPALSPADVVVVMIPRAMHENADRDLAHLGPIAIAHESMRSLVILLSGLLAMVALSTTAMLVFYTRLVRLRPRKKA